jgi:hypothetical protein
LMLVIGADRWFLRVQLRQATVRSEATALCGVQPGGSAHHGRSNEDGQRNWQSARTPVGSLAALQDIQGNVHGRIVLQAQFRLAPIRRTTVVEVLFLRFSCLTPQLLYLRYFATPPGFPRADSIYVRARHGHVFSVGGRGVATSGWGYILSNSQKFRLWRAKKKRSPVSPKSFLLPGKNCHTPQPVLAGGTEVLEGGYIPPSPTLMSDPTISQFTAKSHANLKWGSLS